MRLNCLGLLTFIASVSMTEIHTLLGNAHGMPCALPFKYNNKWYSECTTEGREDHLLWCATSTRYDDTERWGFCPVQGRNTRPLLSSLVLTFFSIDDDICITTQPLSQLRCAVMEGQLAGRQVQRKKAHFRNSITFYQQPAQADSLSQGYIVANNNLRSHSHLQATCHSAE